MSIVDDPMHVVAEKARRERLWQTTDAAASVSVAAPVATPEATPSHPSNPVFRANPNNPSNPNTERASDVLARARAGDLWQARLDLVVSSGLSGDAARKSHEDAQRAQTQASFDALRQLAHDELRPVLDCSVAILGEWGLTARVTETLRDAPARVPRSFDLVLWIDRFGDRGPGKLTITATEGCDFVRVKMAVGPSTMGGDVSEHVGTTIARDLSDALVGGLVATLVEQIFTS